MRQLLIIFVLVLSLKVAAFELPRQLSQTERIQIIEMIGFGTSYKSIHNPYSLGGYKGLEIGVSLENIPTQELRNFGDKSSHSSNLKFPKIEIGKGLYNNLDLYFHVIPYTVGPSLSGYGGALRWTFYESQSLPANIALVLHGSASNLGNQFLHQNLGSLLQLGVGFGMVSINISAGLIKGYGKFMGGAAGVTDSLGFAAEQSSSAQLGINGVVNFQSFYVGLSLDHYTQSMVTLKLGYVF